MADAFLMCLQAKAVKAAEEIPDPQPTSTVADTNTCTPLSKGGFLPIHVWHSTFLFNDINYQQMVNWLKLAGPCVFVQPLAHGYYPPEIAQEIAGVL